MVYEINRQVLPTAPSPTTTHLRKKNKRQQSIIPKYIKVAPRVSTPVASPSMFNSMRSVYYLLNRSYNHDCGFREKVVEDVWLEDILSSCREDERAALTGREGAGGRACGVD